MAKKQQRGLADTAKDKNAKDSFVSGGEGSPAKQTTADDLKMLNTRVHKDLVKRMKVVCAEKEITIQEFMTEAISNQLSKMRG